MRWQDGLQATLGCGCMVLLMMALAVAGWIAVESTGGGDVLRQGIEGEVVILRSRPTQEDAGSCRA